LREKEEIALAAEGSVVLRFLPIYEELGMAQKEVGKIADEATRKGALLVLSKLCAAFEKDGLQPMKLEGEKLDPFRHEVAMREDSEKPEGTIVRVIRQGYFLKGEVLQHALVSVSSGTAPGQKQGEKDGKEKNAADDAENAKKE
jgi:molecular chaperone GrpE